MADFWCWSRGQETRRSGETVRAANAFAAAKQFTKLRATELRNGTMVVAVAQGDGPTAVFTVQMRLALKFSARAGAPEEKA